MSDRPDIPRPDPSATNPPARAHNLVEALTLHYEVSRLYEPLLELTPGDTVTVVTEDAFTGQITTARDRRDKRVMPWSNPTTGPIAVRGALPGDAVVLEICEIRPAKGRCATYIPTMPEMQDLLGSPAGDWTRVCVIRDGIIEWDDERCIPYSPMIGVVATAPALGAPTTGSVGDYGGNLDLREIRPGCRLRLPVFVEGAFLYLGDCHACQGDGEVTGAALEMAAEVTVRVDLIKEAQLLGPQFETESEIGAVAAGDLRQAVPTAYGRLARWLASDYEWDPWAAFSYITQIGTLSFGYYGLGVVAAKVEKNMV
jgi:amidase